MLNKEFEKILKEKNFSLFEKEATFDLTFFKKLIPYLSYGKLYKINAEGYILKKDFIPILKLVELYFCEKRKEVLKDIFDYLINQKTKIRFKKIFRYSSTDFEKIKENFFKTLINKDVNFSLRYGKELFLRNEEEFEKTILKFSLFNLGYKSYYALSLIKLANLFPQVLDELLYIFLVPYCNEENNLYFYDKAYFTKEEDFKNQNFEQLLQNKSPSSLKFYIKNNYKKSLNELIAIIFKNVNKIDFIYLMELESLIYFSKFEDNNEILGNIILRMCFTLFESFNEVNKNLDLKGYVVKNIEKMLV